MTNSPRTIEIRTIAPRPYVGVRRVVKHDGLGPACGEILPRLAAWLGAKRIQPDGPPMIVYHSVDTATGDFDVAPAFFLRSGAEGADEHSRLSRCPPSAVRCLVISCASRHSAETRTAKAHR